MPESYMITIDTNVHPAQYILDLAIGSQKVRDWWTEGDIDGQPKEKCLITLNAPEHSLVLEELCKAGAIVEPAPAGFYSGEPYNAPDCVIYVDGGTPVELGRRRGQ
jgi:hypothetical protein